MTNLTWDLLDGEHDITELLDARREQVEGREAAGLRWDQEDDGSSWMDLTTWNRS